jgi:RNA polymerase sigma factor (TIGR02999 family)
MFSNWYRELYRMAQRELSKHGDGAALGANTLLHETYLYMSGRGRIAFPDRNRFMVYASRVMRGLIIDATRSRQAHKRGGQIEMVAITAEVAEALPDESATTRIRDALDALATVDPRLARVVNLKVFSGFTLAEIAAIQGVSTRTVRRDWEKARIFLLAHCRGHFRSS